MGSKAIFKQICKKVMWMEMQEIIGVSGYYRPHNLLWNYLFFWDIIGPDETFSEPGFQVSGVSFQAGSRVSTPETSYETTLI